MYRRDAEGVGHAEGMNRPEKSCAIKSDSRVKACLWIARLPDIMSTVDPNHYPLREIYELLIDAIVPRPIALVSPRIPAACGILASQFRMIVSICKDF